MPVYSRKQLRELTDIEIVALITSESQTQYFEEIYDRYATRILQKCMSFTHDRDEAQDLAHDIIVKVYMSLSRFNQQSKLSTWIYSIAYNHCVDYYAKKKKKTTIQEEVSVEQLDVADEVSDEEILDIKIETLDQLMKQLTPAEVSILLMKYQDGFSIKDIAIQTNSGESAVKMKLKRTKSKLIKLYKDEKGRER